MRGGRQELRRVLLRRFGPRRQTHTLERMVIVSAKIAKRTSYLPQLIVLTANGISASAQQSLSSLFGEIPEAKTRSKPLDRFGWRHNAAP
jgi:hypothetical protein